MLVPLDGLYLIPLPARPSALRPIESMSGLPACCRSIAWYSARVSGLLATKL